MHIFKKMFFLISWVEQLHVHFKDGIRSNTAAIYSLDIRQTVPIFVDDPYSILKFVLDA